MSYLVLARKWRPETFAEVVGQKHVVLTLAAAVETDRVAHAHLFAGPRGVGKTTVARILAKSLNCEKGPTGEPCGKCTSCVEIASGRSLDVIEIDGASNRKIEDARGIRETVQYAPLSGRMKVYIIDEAHMLTREAFNALLKTLEEPPPHVVFILATTEPGKIPETIASRCQRFDFRRLSSSEIEGRLSEIADAEDVDVEEGALRLVATRADGSMRDAVSLLDQLISVGRGKIAADDVARVLGIPDIDVYFAISDAVAASDTAATLGSLEEALNSGFDPRDLLDGFVEHLRNLLLLRSAPDPDRLVGRIADYRDHEGPSLSVLEDDLVRLIRIGVEAQAAAKWSTQPSLIVELAFLRMAKLPSSVDIEKILKAVDVAGNAGSSGTRGASRGGSTGRAGGGGREAASDVTTTSSTAATDDAAPARASSDGSGAAASDDSATRSTAASDEPYDRAGGTLGRGTSSKTADLSADRWPDVLERIREERPSLAASLSEAVPSVPSAGSLGIHVPNGTRFHRDQLRDRSNMSIVESAASEIFGEAVSVELDFGARERPPDADERPAASPGAAARPRVKKETRSRPAADTEATARPGRAGETATNDPMVRKVMEMFDGRITSQRREE